MGRPPLPFTSSFTTGASSTAVGFEFEKIQIGGERSTASVDIGPDGHLYALDVFGNVRRYLLDPNNGRSTGVGELTTLNGQAVGSIFDPGSTVSNIILWATYVTDCNRLLYMQSRISKLEIPSVGANGSVCETIYIEGLPHASGDKGECAHQPNGLTFGPGSDGWLYQSVGGVATLGRTANWKASESILSAKVIRMDVNGVSGRAFNGGNLPLNVSPRSPHNYDPYARNAPVEIFATGFRNMYDITWHPNGHLYGATNQNSIGGDVKIPGTSYRDGNRTRGKAITVRSHEMFYRIVQSKYYGHPNPVRNECILNGGNPTNGNDPFQVTNYQNGMDPDPNLDPSLIWDIRNVGGNSANGIDVFSGVGPLNRRFLMAFFTDA